MNAGAERLAHAIHAHWPDVRCFGCLAARLGLTEAGVRNEAQMILARGAQGFVLERRVCSSCQRPGEWLVERNPLTTVLHQSPCVVRRVRI